MEQQPKHSRKDYLTLFTSTFTLSAFTFGGGFVIIPLMRKKFVEQLHWIDEEEMMDLTAIAQSSPGAIAVNASILVGYRVAGVPGALVTVLGTVLPPLIILTFVTLGYHVLQGNPMMLHAMTGVRAAVVPIILSSAVALRKGAFTYPVCFGIAAVAFALSLFWDVGCIPLILFGMAAGVAVCEWKKRKGEGPHGAA